MTTNDWVGTILAIIIAILMFAAYFYAFRPKNKDRFKDYDNFVNQEED